MKINKHNYEAWFLDYTEGRLPEANTQELFLFLEQNPLLKKELEEYGAIILPVAKITFEGKGKLKKPIYSDDTLIAYLENDIGKKKKAELEKAIAEHNHVKKEIDLYKRTIFIPDAAIVFEHKEKLKKRRFAIIWNNPANYLRVAAAVLLLIGLLVLISRQLDKEPGLVLAKKEIYLPERKKVQKNISSSTTPLIQNTLIAVKGGKKTFTKRKNNNINLQDSLRKIITVNKLISVINDSVEKNDDKKNNLALTNSMQDTLTNQSFIVSQENTNQSYFNHATDIDENNTAVLQAKVNPKQAKRPLFKFLSSAAKGAKLLGAKHVDVKEESNQSTIVLGGIALSETVSN